MKVTIEHGGDAGTTEVECQSIIMHQSGCVHLMSQRFGRTDAAIAYEQNEDWEFLKWTSDDGAEIIIHNAGVL